MYIGKYQPEIPIITLFLSQIINIVYPSPPLPHTPSLSQPHTCTHTDAHTHTRTQTHHLFHLHSPCPFFPLAHMSGSEFNFLSLALASPQEWCIHSTLSSPSLSWCVCVMCSLSLSLRV